MNEIEYKRNLEYFKPYMEIQAEKNKQGTTPSLPIFRNMFQSFVLSNKYLTETKTYSYIRISQPNLTWFMSVWMFGMIDFQ